MSLRIVPVLMLFVAFATAGIARAEELDPVQETRYRAFTQELRCLVCQNQNIADSNAPLANDLREQVKAQILAGRSDAEITRYVTDRYGDFVLYNPPLKASTVALWLLPFVLLIAALAAAWRHTHRRRTVTSAPVDEAALKRLLDEKPGKP